ncbi:MAG: trypsin-like peptidase domain-containing protein [Clostridia bacterium]|nr:trypsin-like peptidase domain-containing protein [Clostridia bacterium]
MKQKHLIKTIFCAICILFLPLFAGGCTLENMDFSTMGMSAYEIAVKNGFTGTEEEWLESLKGEDGAYAGQGLSAYEVAVENGFVGSEAQWLASLNNFEDAFQLSMNKCLTSVVSIRASVTDGTSSGSGVIVEYNKTNGYAYVLTNFHVVCDDTTKDIADSIYCYSYGREYEDFGMLATYVGGAPECDIAVLKVYISSSIAEKTVITCATVGDSGTMAVGTRIGAIGNSKGKGIAVTAGVLGVESEYSEFVRPDASANGTVRVMRYDAYIINGNSGGGLFNVDGELIGIVNAKSSSVEFYYAIPINLAYSIYLNVRENCSSTDLHADRICLGVELAVADSVAVLDDETQTVYIKETVFVEEIKKSAMMSYFKVNDEIISVTHDGVTYDIQRYYDVSDLMWRVNEGDSLTFKIKRNGQITNVQLTASNNLTIYENINSSSYDEIV